MLIICYWLVPLIWVLATTYEVHVFKQIVHRGESGEDIHAYIHTGYTYIHACIHTYRLSVRVW